MANQVGTVSNLIQGVSQQDPKIRAIGQVSEQINMRSHTARGLIKRPGTKFEYKLPALPDSLSYAGMYFHQYSSGDSDYLVVFNADGIGVIDASTGTWQALSDGTGTYSASFKDPLIYSGSYYSTYMDGATAISDMQAYTLADTTFLLNKTKTVAMAGSASVSDYSFIYVKAATFGLTYRVYIDEVEVVNVALPTTATVASGAVNLANVPSIRDITLALADGIAAAGYTAVVINDNVIQINNTNLTYSVRVDDDTAGNDITCYTEYVNKYEDLPAVGGLSSVICVSGDKDAKDEYFLIGTGVGGVYPVTGSAVTYTNPRDGSSATWTGGLLYEVTDFRWDEVASRKQANSLSAATMPLTLTKNASGFVVSWGVWEDRPAGDSDTNPNPKFVGKTISGMGSYQNRLVFLAGKYVCASRTDEWFAFWKDTVVTDNPANPCNIAAISTDSSGEDLKSMCTIAGDLLLFTDSSQYRIFGDQPFTAATPIVKVGSIKVDTNIPAVTTDIGAMICYSSGTSTTVKELVVAGDSRLIVPVDLTAHCPYYITDRPMQLLMHNTHNIGFLRTATAETAPSLELWVYECGRDSSGKRKQMAWHKWVFGSATNPDHVTFMWLKDDYLWLALRRADVSPTEWHVYTLPLDPATTEFLDFRPHLDRMQEVTTELLLPSEADVECGDDVVCLLLEDASGSQLAASVDSGRLTISEQEYIDSQTGVLVGRPFDSRTRLSTLYLRQTDGTPRTTNRTQLLRMWLSYTYTAHIEVDVTDKAGTTTSKTWDSREDAINGVWDSVTLQDGTLAVPLRGTNTDVTIEIHSDDYTPVGVTALQFTARYGKRATARAKNTII